MQVIDRPETEGRAGTGRLAAGVWKGGGTGRLAARVWKGGGGGRCANLAVRARPESEAPAGAGDAVRVVAKKAVHRQPPAVICPPIHVRRRCHLPPRCGRARQHGVHAAAGLAGRALAVEVAARVAEVVVAVSSLVTLWPDQRARTGQLLCYLGPGE